MAKTPSTKSKFSNLSNDELKTAYRLDFTNEDEQVWHAEIHKREEPLLKKYRKYLEDSASWEFCFGILFTTVTAIPTVPHTSIG